MIYFQASLLKYYIVYALQNNRQEKVLDCFEKLGADLQLQSEWKEWFGKTDLLHSKLIYSLNIMHSGTSNTLSKIIHSK